MQKQGRRIQSLEFKVKQHLKFLLKKLGLAISRNMAYDRYTEQIMRMTLTENSNCIDAGCHQGDVLAKMVALSPKGMHFAFEPLPEFYYSLIKKFTGMVKIFPYALSDTSGKTSFVWVRNAPAYSGIKKRKYDIRNPVLETIEVEMRRLDDIIPDDIWISFMKVDVEGAEWTLFLGAEKTIGRCKPVIVFECGLGASEYYNTTPESIYEFFVCRHQMKLSLLKAFVNREKELGLDEFMNYYETSSEYYFVAHS